MVQGYDDIKKSPAFGGGQVTGGVNVLDEA